MKPTKTRRLAPTKKLNHEKSNCIQTHILSLPLGIGLSDAVAWLYRVNILRSGLAAVVSALWTELFRLVGQMVAMDFVPNDGSD